MTYYRSHSIRVTSTTELGEAESLLSIYMNRPINTTQED